MRPKPAAAKVRRAQVSLSTDVERWIHELLRKDPRALFRIPQVRDLITIQRLYSVPLDEMEVAERVDPASIKDAVEYNKTMLRNIKNHVPSLHRPRFLIDVLTSIYHIFVNRQTMKVLCVGPRTESEFFMLLAEDFKHENLTGLDIISYSDFVDVGDMHDMPYPDDTFDIVILGWTLTYSKDMQRVADECVRVAKPGGYVAVGVEFDPNSKKEALYGFKLTDSPEIPTTDAMLALFKDHVHAVPFRHDVHRSRKGKLVDHVMVVMELK